MTSYFLLERRGDGIHRQIVVRWPDTACGENVIKQSRKQTNFAGNQTQVVGNNRYLLQVNAKGPQLAGEEQGILVLCLPRQNLIPDDDDPRRFSHVFFTITKAARLHHIESGGEPLQTCTEFIGIATNADTDVVGHFEEPSGHDGRLVFLAQQ